MALIGKYSVPVAFEAVRPRNTSMKVVLPTAAASSLDVAEAYAVVDTLNSTSTGSTAVVVIYMDNTKSIQLDRQTVKFVPATPGASYDDAYAYLKTQPAFSGMTSDNVTAPVAPAG